MSRIIIEQYENEKGELILNIYKDTTPKGRVSYSYHGKGSYGAGCQSNLEEMRKCIFAGMSSFRMKRTIKRDVIVQNVFPN